MPYARVEDRHAARARAQVKAKAFVAKRRAETACVRCGKKPIDWHSEEHIKKPNRRISRMAAQGKSLFSIAAEIARCEALCRRCHMIGDGRLPRFVAASAPTRQRATEPKSCGACGKTAKPLRKGLCNRCNHRERAQERKRLQASA